MKQYKQENPLFEYLYLLGGQKPQQQYILHLIFQHFEKDQKLSRKLCQIILNYQDANQRNNENLTPLHIAIKYNQIAAIRFAQQDYRFDFNQDGLMSIAISLNNFTIIEILLLEENISLIESNHRKMNCTSATNLKILKKYEILELHRTIFKKEDIEESDESNINCVPQFPIQQIPDKECDENISEIDYNTSFNSIIIPQTNSIKRVEDKIKYSPNLLKCEIFIEQLLTVIFNFCNPQLDMTILLSLRSLSSSFIFPQTIDLIQKVGLSIPHNPVYKSFNIMKLVEEKCQIFFKSLKVWIKDYREKLKRTHGESQLFQLKKTLSNKLQQDISYVGPHTEFLSQFWELMFRYANLYQILQRPKLHLDSNLILLQEFELLNEEVIKYHISLYSSHISN